MEDVEKPATLVTLLAESLVGALAQGDKKISMNARQKKRFYEITGELSNIVRRQFGYNVDFEIGLKRYLDTRAMLNGMSESNFLDRVCKSNTLSSWEDLMFYNYI